MSLAFGALAAARLPLAYLRILAALRTRGHKMSGRDVAAAASGFCPSLLRASERNSRKSPSGQWRCSARRPTDLASEAPIRGAGRRDAHVVAERGAALERHGLHVGLARQEAAVPILYRRGVSHRPGSAARRGRTVDRCGATPNVADDRLGFDDHRQRVRRALPRVDPNWRRCGRQRSGSLSLAVGHVAGRERAHRFVRPSGFVTCIARGPSRSLFWLCSRESLDRALHPAPSLRRSGSRGRSHFARRTQAAVPGPENKAARPGVVDHQRE